MNFSDIFKSSFLGEYAVDMSVLKIFIYISFAAVMGFYIFMIYRVMTKKSFYNKSFNVSLWVLAVVTASIIITISSNIVLSLGMVGALSIVRYRTAIKDPMDLVFLFWSISEGIMCGAGMIAIAAIVAVILTVGILILDKLPAVKPLKIMTISADSYDCEDEIIKIVKSYCKIYKIKSRTLSIGDMNLVMEFRTDKEKECTDSLMKIDNVYSVVTLSHDGEVTF